MRNIDRCADLGHHCLCTASQVDCMNRTLSWWMSSQRHLLMLSGARLFIRYAIMMDQLTLSFQGGRFCTYIPSNVEFIILLASTRLTDSHCANGSTSRPNSCCCISWHYRSTDYTRPCLIVTVFRLFGFEEGKHLYHGFKGL